jgi:monofunctional biosynthetic peptidoglycan transglycosylase
VRKLLRGLVVAASLCFIYVAYVYLTLPDVRLLATGNPGTTAFMELRMREAEAAGRALKVRQRWVPYAQISNHLRRAVIVAEDATFFDHDGIDLKELRASLEHNWEEGRFERGASTITQQLAKNLYLSPSRNPIRKLKELLITRRLEAALTKRRILEIYLNVIEWGDGIFGAEAAARAYFSKPASALSPSEAALLAGAIINPREHNPARPTARLLRRQAIIAHRMGIKPAAPDPIDAHAPVADAPQSGQVDEHSSATNPPQLDDNPSTVSPRNQSPPSPPGSAQTVQPISGNSGSQPLRSIKPTGKQ